jgi:cold shock CspA family protein
MIGKVVTFFRQRHYGFLVDATSGTEFFFHESDLGGGPIPANGQPVSFTLGTWGGREKAFNVRALSAREVSGAEGGAQ